MEQITTFRDETRELLIKRPNHLSSKYVAEKIGKTPQWVNRFARGDELNPGIIVIETLNAFLKQEIKKVSKNVK